MRFVRIIGIFIICIFVIVGILFYFFGPVKIKSEAIIFTVPQNITGFNPVSLLASHKYIRNPFGFRLLLTWFSGGETVKPGGYRLDKQMNAWQVMKKVTWKPDLLWVTISGCQRKEQIGEKLAGIFGWDKSYVDRWNNAYTTLSEDYKEGVYYPDTYLIPVDEAPEIVAKRFIAKFNEAFAPLAVKFMAKNIRWVTGLKIASLIARESGGADDMKRISGIIWNRLDQGIPLQIDATMQYTEGQRSDGSWWGPVDLTEKKNDSPYNSYLYKGLPPTPICSPAIDKIDAVLNPEDTDCLYYLHDHNKKIHCAKTYEEHKANIATYL